MIIHTASEGVTLAKKLENDSAGFYETLAQKFSNQSENFLAFAKENKRNVTQIERAYYGVITDAIEGCYAFNLNDDDYSINTTLASDAGISTAVKQAVQLEEKIVQFYKTAAEQSGSLMADVPRTFSMIAKKRENRVAKLKSLS